MADIDLKTLTVDTSVPANAVLFGADSQAAASPSVYNLSDVLAQASPAGVAKFDAAKAYSVNDIVVQAGKIYRANGAVAAGVFNASNWTEIGAPPPAAPVFQTETKTAPAIAAGTLNLDCSAGNVFAVNLNADVTTVNFTNIPPAGKAYGMTLALTIAAAHTVAWPASVKWPGGTTPTLTTTVGKVDIFSLVTWDAGTTWYAFVGGQNI